MQTSIQMFLIVTSLCFHLVKVEGVISLEAWGHVAAVTQSGAQTDTVGRLYKQKEALWEHGSYTIQLLSDSSSVCYVSDFILVI